MKRPTTANYLRRQIADLEAQLTIKQATIELLKDHQRELTQTLTKLAGIPNLRARPVPVPMADNVPGN